MKNKIENISSEAEEKLSKFKLEANLEKDKVSLYKLENDIRNLIITTKKYAAEQSDTFWETENLLPKEKIYNIWKAFYISAIKELEKIKEKSYENLMESYKRKLAEIAIAEEILRK